MPITIEMRELQLADGEQVAAIHEVMKVQDNFSFLLSDYVQGEAFGPYLERVAEYKNPETVPEGKVVSTFFVAVIDGKIAGRVSIRHSLNEFLALTGGHVGYAVAREFRGQGVATYMLRFAIDFCRDLGIEKIFISCRVGNDASRSVIEKCGGEFARIVEDHNKNGGSFRTYWIPTSR